MRISFQFSTHLHFGMHSLTHTHTHTHTHTPTWEQVKLVRCGRGERGSNEAPSGVCVPQCESSLTPRQGQGGGGQAASPSPLPGLRLAPCCGAGARNHTPALGNESRGPETELTPQWTSTHTHTIHTLLRWSGHVHFRAHLDITHTHTHTHLTHLTYKGAHRVVHTGIRSCVNVHMCTN